MASIEIIMKKQQLIFICFWLMFCVESNAQQTLMYTNPDASFERAKAFFQKNEISLAYPIFLQLQAQLKSADNTNNSALYDEVRFYVLVCGLKQQEELAVREAKAFVSVEHQLPLKQKLSYHLGEYYFQKEQYKDAVMMYDHCTEANLSPEEFNTMKFHLGYGYFTMQQYAKAKPLLGFIAAKKNDPNYADANYYYGFIAFKEKNFSMALEAFKKVDHHPQYGKTAPFYIATIQYKAGKKEEALAYAIASLQSNPNGLYDKELKALIGHIYFEKQQFSKALPYLEAFVQASEKVSREDLYQLSYAYYDAKQFDKAIDGFKQLSGSEDSLSQSAMYVLGDAYLKTGQKANARNAFSFCAANTSNAVQREVSAFNYGKLSYELGYQDVALSTFKDFLQQYPNSTYSSEATELLAGILARTNNYREALELLEKLSNLSTSAKKIYPKVLYGRAIELINDGNTTLAEPLLDRILKVQENEPFLPGTLFWKGEIAFQNGNLDAAIKYLNNYLVLAPNQMGELNPINAKYNLGYCYLKKENYPLALDFFEQVAKQASSNAPEIVKDAFLRSADCLFMIKQFQKAREKYSTVINYSWTSADYATYQVAMIDGIKSAENKLNLLRFFERKFPTSSLLPTVNMEIANTYLADEKFKEAIPYLNIVINTAEQVSDLKPKAFLGLGIAYFNLNNNVEALANYNKLITLFPNAPEVDDALESAKAIYVEEGKPREYVDFVKKAGRSISQHQQDSLTFAIAEAKYSNQDAAGAIVAFTSYLEQFPEGEHKINALYFRSELFNTQKRWIEALPGYEEVANQAPNPFAERATQQAARICYFEIKDYIKAEQFFALLKKITVSNATKLDAMRGLLRAQYQLKKWDVAGDNAAALLKEKGISIDDKIIASMILGKLSQINGSFVESIQYFRSVTAINKAAYAAEARYEIAACYLLQDDLKNAEKAAFETINKSGSYDFWITKAYLILGDIFVKQKDYFNAKATFQSIVKNSKNEELKNEAQTKLDIVIAEEKKTGKIEQ
jgi:tetratricopeptide (TPR) repeat protein